MDTNNARELLVKYNAGNCTDEEKAIVEGWYLQLPYQAPAPGAAQIKAAHGKVWAAMQTPAHPVKKLFPFKWLAAAALLIFGLGIGAYLLLNKSQPAATSHYAETRHILPGSNKAILTLAGGQTVILSDTMAGQVGVQGHTTIKQTAKGQITYQADNNKAQTADDLKGANILSTPRGGQYKLTLADGTIAWLDAASAIKYPVVFTGGLRHVEITGQVYFEVVHNSAMPFTVTVKGQTIADMGTQFNINAYDDEEDAGPGVKTTLLQGQVKVSNTGGAAVLKPGEQAASLNQGLQVAPVNVKDVMAWKNGYFRFNGGNIRAIMQEVARWYNVDVVYQGKPNDEGYNGIVSRSKNISEVLDVLESTNTVKFKVAGRRITVIQ